MLPKWKWPQCKWQDGGLAISALQQADLARIGILPSMSRAEFSSNQQRGEQGVPLKYENHDYVPCCSVSTSTSLSKGTTHPLLYLSHHR